MNCRLMIIALLTAVWMDSLKSILKRFWSVIWKSGVKGCKRLKTSLARKELDGEGRISGCSNMLRKIKLDRLMGKDASPRKDDAL